MPKWSEGFSRITLCQSESDVQAAIDTYSALGPQNTLPSGSFGQKNPDAKVQLGIMKFLKKVNSPVNAVSKGDSLKDSVTTDKENDYSSIGREEVKGVEEVKGGEDLAFSSLESTSSFDNVPTLAFPSISTADFQFDLEKASDIIVEKVLEFVTKLGNAKFVLVDLSSGAKKLSLVRAKAGEKNWKIPNICGRYYSALLRRRLKPGGGGVNAAIFSAAGPSLETATMERAGSLAPGKAVVVPLPSTSPLFCREGVTHVIHVLGPNMNRKRPNFLNKDYKNGCEVLREAYSALFEGFASIVKSQKAFYEEPTGKLGSVQLVSPVDFKIPHKNQFSNADQKVKREDVYESDRNKKCKVIHGELGSQTGATNGIDNAQNEKNNGSMSKAWGAWDQSLYHIATNPEKHKNDVMEISDDIVVVNDLYPKAPSLQHLHLHVISQDFDSKHLKNKKHWNSFNTAFFRDSVDVMEEIDKFGRATLKEEDILSMELRCHRCRSAHPNIPRLKSHIGNCLAPFPAPLLQNGRLLFATDRDGANQ
ncbi:hypothetical protein RHMOL_Rhmol05G0304000 [Rhododendron molle]|uniref:Uncharacterized protein n=1 Tax=Rhododendron molle TaxID=49168 RepID=A0ACC0NW81_RHOML|nr:hypothetical protein RHMOL_Rhmol05G0304000 [Rhododendron molle]